GTTIDRGYDSGIVPTVFKVNKDGSGFVSLHRFSSYAGQGENPPNGLVLGSDGVLYGTVQAGGTHSYGFIFKLNRDGSNYALLRSLIGPSGGDAQNPGSALVEGSDGALYGATVDNGFGSDPGPMAFKINKDGRGYTIMHNFSSYDGDGPMAKLLEGTDGALYGTTSGGGYSYPNNVGTVFRLNKDGSGFSILHFFTSSSGEGRNPRAALVQGT